MKDIYALAYELHDLLESDERVILLHNCSKELQNSEEIKELVAEKEKAFKEYLKVKEESSPNSSALKNAQNKLYQAKYTLDTHPIARKYLDAYSAVRDLNYRIDDILFSGLSLHLKENE